MDASPSMLQPLWICLSDLQSSMFRQLETARHVAWRERESLSPAQFMHLLRFVQFLSICSISLWLCFAYSCASDACPLLCAGALRPAVSFLLDAVGPKATREQFREVLVLYAEQCNKSGWMLEVTHSPPTPSTALQHPPATFSTCSVPSTAVPYHSQPKSTAVGSGNMLFCDCQSC